MEESTEHIEVKKAIDWKAVELDFRAGVKSLEQIGKENGVAKSRISVVAKRDGWVRDLKNRIKAKADARVNEAAVNDPVNAKENKLAERDIVDANAALQYKVRISHRADLGRLGKLKNKVIDHIETVIDNLDDLNQVIAMLRNPDDSGQDKANDQLRKAMSRSVVTDDLKKLVEIDEKLRKGEREAFGIDEAQAEANSDEGLYLKIIRAKQGQ